MMHLFCGVCQSDVFVYVCVCVVHGRAVCVFCGACKHLCVFVLQIERDVC